MKSNGQPSLYFSPNASKAPNRAPSAKPSYQSPYLRAVLTDKRASRPARVLSLANSSMAAALRYIANSK